MGSQSSVLEGSILGPPEIGLGDRNSSMNSLSLTVLPRSLSYRAIPQLSHSITTKFRADGYRRRQRPLSCVLPDPCIAVPLRRSDANSLGQIVVVSEAPPNLFRSSSTPKMSGVLGRWREDPQWEIHQLQHRVPLFEPLDRWKELEGCDPTPLAEMVELYKRHYATIAEILVRKQDEILQFEQEVEHDYNCAVESMRIRQSSDEFQTSFSPLDPKNTVTADVNQMKQIFSGVTELHDRFTACSYLIDELTHQAQELSQIVPLGLSHDN